MKTDSYDFAIIGSGFGGSIMSMVLRRLGKSVLLLEKGLHPRFAIGESSTPFANLLLEKIGFEFDLPFLRSLSEWGSWQEAHRNLPAGLKRGFTFYHHTPGQSLDLADRRTQLLVAASPNDRVADTHWYRPPFDEFLVQRAVEIGVVYRDRATVSDAQNDSGTWKMRVITDDGSRSICARFLIDASGPGGFAPLNLTAGPCPHMPPTASVYAHFRNVPRLDPYRTDSPPYPPDDAAVHHVFAGGWIWVLRFNNGITSAGAVLPGHPSPKRAEPASIWNSLLDQFPTIHRLFHEAEPTTPFYYLPQVSFRRPAAAGTNWALLPSAAGFVDPLLSTGFALTLLGILRLGEIFRTDQLSPAGYEVQTFADLDAASDLVSALFSKMDSFEEFSLLSLLYFAALSFTETAWRLSKRELASGFLLANDSAFSASRRELCARARAGHRVPRADVFALIEPYDLAGLTDHTRHPWYPVNFDDLHRNAHKVSADTSDLALLRQKMGVATP